MSDVDVEEVRAVVRWLRSEIGVPFAVVGGSAILPEVPVGTKEVDILVSGPDLEKVDRRMEDRADAPPVEPATGTIRGTEVAIGGSSIQVDFLSGSAFGGPEFIGYVLGPGSKAFAGVRRARPAVVFYMRLALDEWRENVPSIERDLRVGIPESTLDGAVAVARRFGRGAKVAYRVAEVRRLLADLDPRRQ